MTEKQRISSERFQDSGIVRREAQVLKRSADTEILQREARVLLGVVHPALPRFDGWIVEDTGTTLVTEWCGETTLADLDSARRPGAYVCVLATLVDLHRSGIVHGDLKPSHILIDSRDRVRLIDWGYGTFPGFAPLRSTGTLGYAAPELFAGAAPSPASDIYALAVTIGESIGVRAREAAAARTLDPIERELRRAFDETPQFAAELVRGLACAPEERPSAARLLELFVRETGASAPMPCIATVLQDRELATPPTNTPIRLEGTAGCGATSLLRTWAWHDIERGRTVLGPHRLPVALLESPSSLPAAHSALRSFIDEHGPVRLLQDEVPTAAEQILLSAASRLQHEFAWARQEDRLSVVLGSWSSAGTSYPVTGPSNDEMRRWHESVIAAERIPGEDVGELARLAQGHADQFREGLAYLMGGGRPSDFAPTAGQPPRDHVCTEEEIELLDRAGEYEASLVLARELVEPMSLRLLERWVELELSCGDGDHLRAAIGRCADRGETARAQRWQAHAALQSGELGEAERIATAAAASTSDQALRAHLLNTAALAMAFQGRTDEARRTLKRARREGRLTPAILDVIFNSAGIIEQLSGRRGRAIQCYRRAERASKKAKRLDRLATRAINVATVLIDAGRYARARDSLRRALRHALRYGSARDQLRALTNLANLELELGNTDETQHLIDLADRLPGDMQRERERLILIRAEVALECGDARQCMELLAKGPETIDHANGLERRLLTARAQGELGHPELAIEHLAALVNPLGARALAYAGHLMAIAGAPRRLKLDVGSKSEPAWSWIVQSFAAALDDEDGQGSEASIKRESAKTALQQHLLRLPPTHRSQYLARPICRAARGLLERGESHGSFLERILEINRELCAFESLDALLQRILEHAIELLGCERGLILVQGEEGKLATVRRGMDPGEGAFSSSLAGRVLDDGEGVRTSDATADPRFAAQASVRALKLRSALCVPVRSGPIRGALYLDNRVSDSVLNDDDLELAQAFAHQAAIALHNADARAQLEKRAKTLQAKVELQTEELVWARTILANRSDEEELKSEFPKIVGSSPPMLKLMSTIRRFAPVRMPVFIHGESGTGKELVARAFHDHSDRRAGPYVALNCGAVPTELLEAELFGVRKGAYTGAADDRPGLFKVADEGTVFLDEVGDMPSEMQVKLLRILESGTFRAVGSETEESTNVRVVCASNKSLPELVEAGDFRADLYYRLAGITVTVPALRERATDIPMLAYFLLERAAREMGTDVPDLSAESIDALQNYDWPGNVRQLDNELKRAAILSSSRIEFGNLSDEVRAAGHRVRTERTERPEESSLPTQRRRHKDAMRAFERAFLEDAISRHDGDVAAAAKALGISRSSLYAKFKSLEVPQADGH